MEKERGITIINKSENVSELKSGKFKVIKTPISERYCKVGDIVTLDAEHNKIRCSGTWFDFDKRWLIEEHITINCVCLLTNTEGKSVHKIFTEALAKQWNFYRMFTGTYEECLGFMQANGY